MKTGRLAVLLALVLTTAFASAKAVIETSATYDFSNLKANGPGGSFLPSGVFHVDYWHCTGGDLCSANIDHSSTLGDDLEYTATDYYDGGITVSAVPENSTWTMTVGGLGLLAIAARRRRIDIRFD
jgi:hypothetical protein